MLALLLSAALAAAPPALSVTASPPEIFIERGGLQQLNFDFVVDNPGDSDVELRSIEMSVYDDKGRLVLRRDADRSGAAPAIMTVGPDREVKGKTKGLIYNPFTVFPLDFSLHELRYRLTFAPQKGEKFDREVTVRPLAWVPRTSLILPVDGQQWAKHGHDYLSHHRRWNPLHPIAQSFGATAIFARYALDLLVVDEAGKARKSGAKRNDDYFGWGASVLAPAGGTIAAAYGDEPDDDLATGKSAFDPARLPKEPLHFYGNYVIIDHGNREFSVLGHLMHGSVTVKPGDRVAQGQQVGRIGASGSAEFEPHLHYELRRGPEMSAEGLPAYFANFLRAGTPGIVALGPVNSGEFVENAAHRR